MEGSGDSRGLFNGAARRWERALEQTLSATAVLAAMTNRFSIAVEAGEETASARHPIFAAGLHVLAIGLALGAAMLAARWLGEAAWFATPFLATSIYLAAASVELALALELSARDSMIAHGGRPRRRP